jgi:alpha,alpha-trehalase
MKTLEKAKIYTASVFTKKEPQLTVEAVAGARSYINNYWRNLIKFHPKDEGSLIGLPYPYLVPSYAEGREFDFDELFYWDSYFMVQGLWQEDNKELITGILEDLLFLFKRFRIIPNSSQYFMTGRSQPPFLTSLIMDIDKHYDMGQDWVNERMAIAKEEYQGVWMGQRKPNARLVYRGLSRYYDSNYLNDIAETESGWDMTTRFQRKTLNFLPVDLNALLYKYESDFARVAKINGSWEEAAKWETAQEQRKAVMNELMWDKFRGLYFDYDYTKARRGTIASLAAYFPMWAGMASEEQAARLVDSLKRFENKGGLATTEHSSGLQFMSVPTQWAYPNGWAPLHFIVVQALERYGYHREAKRIVNRWLSCNLVWFNHHGVFLEKYNVVSPDKPPMRGLYPSQTGFGWTNAVFERFCQDYIDRNE